MAIRKTRFVILSTTLSLALLMALPFLNTAQVRAQNPAPAQNGEVRTMVVDIHDVSTKYHAIFVGEQRFRLSSTAAVLDINGKSMPLSLLPIPCRAKIRYVLFGDNRGPLIQSLQLR